MLEAVAVAWQTLEVQDQVVLVAVVLDQTQIQLLLVELQI
jgi:hypothetical protein